MLHSTIIYGPVHSRRFGHSLGVNLLPARRKICNFECVYCECGWTDSSVKDSLPSVQDVTTALESALATLSAERHPINHISFAGNGEPTLHPHFHDIIDATLDLRDRYFPNAHIAVLSNATRLSDPKTRAALMKIEDRVLKLDAGTEKMFQRLDKPHRGITLDRLTDELCRLEGDLIIQSMFHKGEHDNASVDNTTPDEVFAWIERLKRIRPKLVMIYGLDRQPPAPGLIKATREELEAITVKVRAIGLDAECFV